MKSTLFTTVLLIAAAAATAASARNIDAEKSKKPSNNNNNSGEWLPSGRGGYNIPGLGKLGDESTTQEVQHYWHLKTHSNKPLPPVFLSKLSAFSPSEMIASAVSNSERFHLINKLPLLRIPLSCYNCLHNHLPPLSYNLSVLHPNIPPSYKLPPPSYNHSVDGGTTASANAKSASRRSGFDSIWRGLFFRESLLKEGTTVPLLKFATNRSDQYFLPRSIASKIPLSVDAVSKIFNISANSAMYRAVDSTIDECKAPPNIGESNKCVTSAEDMIDYTLSTLGANTDIQGWSTHNWSGFRGKSSVIGKLKVVYDGKLTGKQQLSCHQVPFPYLLHNCHSVSGTVIYDMEILDSETKEKINQAVAVCHMDTSAWDPNHVAFAVLGTAPGKTEVCHWVVPWEMTFTG